MFGEKVLLLETELVETTEDAAERRRFRRKHGLKMEPVLGPAMIDCREGQGRFRFEKVVETPLFHPGMLTDVIDRGAPVAPRPDQFHHGLEKPFFRIADAPHGWTLSKLDERSTIFLPALAECLHPDFLCRDAGDGGRPIDPTEIVRCLTPLPPSSFRSRRSSGAGRWPRSRRGEPRDGDGARSARVRGGRRCGRGSRQDRSS